MITTGEAIRLGEAAGVDADAILRVVNAAFVSGGLSAVTDATPLWQVPAGLNGRPMSPISVLTLCWRQKSSRSR